MPDAREIYSRHADEYDALVRCEDRAGNLLRAIRETVALDGADVVELGAGTGRMTALLAPLVRSIRAFDIAPSMLALARRRLEREGVRNCALCLADNAAVPVSDGTADLSIAAWTYGHQTVWREDSWRAPIEAALREMLRALRAGGSAVVIETLGTGHTTPFAPPLELARYYSVLEGEYGFARAWVRTDYEFPTADEGERLVRFFFGEERARVFASSRGTSMPECTGVWTRSK